MIATIQPRKLSTAEDRRQLFGDLYKEAFTPVARFISKRGGTLQDAKDLFQDALVIFYEKLADQTVSTEIAHKAYVVGIVKHLWFRKFRAERGRCEVSPEEGRIIDELSDTDPVIFKEHMSLVTFLERTGKKCMDLLKAFYYDKKDMERIREELGYGTAHSATVQKFKCIEKIRDHVKERNVSYEDFA